MCSQSTWDVAVPLHGFAARSHWSFQKSKAYFTFVHLRMPMTWSLSSPTTNRKSTKNALEDVGIRWGGTFDRHSVFLLWCLLRGAERHGGVSDPSKQTKGPCTTCRIKKISRWWRSKIAAGLAL